MSDQALSASMPSPPGSPAIDHSPGSPAIDHSPGSPALDYPSGAPAIRVLAMPADTNPAGDIFGGWLLSQMDIAGSTVAVERSQGRVVTIAVEGMSFLKPVHVGDLVSFHAAIEKTGRTSIRVRIDAWAKRGRSGTEERVTEGVFTYVAIDGNRKSRPIPTG